MEAAYKTYWKTWGILLTLTVVMVFVDVMSFPRMLMLVVLLGAMMTKAYLIATEFMEVSGSPGTGPTRDRLQRAFGDETGVEIWRMVHSQPP